MLIKCGKCNIHMNICLNQKCKWFPLRFISQGKHFSTYMTIFRSSCIGNFVWIHLLAQKQWERNETCLMILKMISIHYWANVIIMIIILIDRARCYTSSASQFLDILSVHNKCETLQCINTSQWPMALSTLDFQLFSLHWTLLFICFRWPSTL